MIRPEVLAPWISPEARAMLHEIMTTPPPPSGEIGELRTHYDSFNRRHLDTALAHYPVAIERTELGGIAVDVVEPALGEAADYTLLCLHGGAFMWGRGSGALLEAVPVAAMLGVRVIAVEYALAPEQVFPAAVEDVLAVYRSLCAVTAPDRIGIYGCSAGAVLTAQTVARLIAEGRPVPGAITMLCGAGLEMLGDSVATAGPLTGQPLAVAPDLASLPYFTGCDVSDPLVFPGNNFEVLARFPPSLLVTGTRDFAASSVMTMHHRLLGAGVEAELLCFDGLWHAYHMATTLPEARETFAAMKRFFTARLG